MKRVIGIDEVGRGCWAGPVVAAAVALTSPIDGLADSKKLSASRRQLLCEVIYETADVGIGWVYADEFNTVGLSRAVGLAMDRAILALQPEAYDGIIIDGTVNYLPDYSGVRTLAKADALIPAVSAASIVAKVARDQFMIDLSAEYPEYGFERHVGYGTAMHHQALKRYGVTTQHRLSYRPIRLIIEERAQ
jgi:ribonuclease HII